MRLDIRCPRFFVRWSSCRVSFWGLTDGLTIMVLVIDNYDLFIYNFVQYFGEFGVVLIVWRNNEVFIEEIDELKLDYFVIFFGFGCFE